MAKRISGFSEIQTDQISYYKSVIGWRFYHPAVGLGSLSNHTVVEHEDGTITVSPSILLQTKSNGKVVSVHGFLEKGIWRDC